MKINTQTDVLIIRGCETANCDERSVIRALQIRDLEQMIVDDRIDLPFVSSAREYNLERGWGRGGPTLASLGIVLGGRA